MIFFYPPKMVLNKKKKVFTFILNRYKLQKTRIVFLLSAYFGI